MGGFLEDRVEGMMVVSSGDEALVERFDVVANFVGCRTKTVDA
jgi:hypothetical protein